MARVRSSRGAPPGRRSIRCAAELRRALFALLLVTVVGCPSGPGRAIQGARHYGAGTAALERGESARAIAELERAAGLVPHASEIQNHLGLAYWQAGDADRARAAFERAVELDCENRAAQSNLSRLERRPGDVPTTPAPRSEE